MASLSENVRKTLNDYDEKILDIYNQIENLPSDIGDVNEIATPTNKVIVDAINSLQFQIFNQQDSITEVAAGCHDRMGDLLTLETVNKTNIVNAINEVRYEIDENRIVQSQNTSNIEILGRHVFELSTSINAVSEDTATINLSHNTETRCNTLTNLTITATTPTDISKQFMSSIKFTSGETATVLEYPEEIKMTGEDCIDDKFVPIANKRYNIIFDFDGVYLIGVVGGVSI